jgi:hypothetical protein
MAFLLQLRAAKTVDDVVIAARDYLRVWDEVLYRLPESCRPEAKDVQDVLTSAEGLKLFRDQALRSGATVSHELGMTAEFFSAAAARIMDLQAQPTSGRPAR